MVLIFEDLLMFACSSSSRRLLRTPSSPTRPSPPAAVPRAFSSIGGLTIANKPRRHVEGPPELVLLCRTTDPRCLEFADAFRRTRPRVRPPTTCGLSKLLARPPPPNKSHKLNAVLCNSHSDHWKLGSRTAVLSGVMSRSISIVGGQDLPNSPALRDSAPWDSESSPASIWQIALESRHVSRKSRLPRVHSERASTANLSYGRGCP
ncbi:uncharacterized protein SEPMUDRAFT_106582 [Sphaerulina musiva SO2202]|uniref:Uncharacterized protein n=1 Tax=Sphaerulina musiva (strain SO2202) TaxID=692275 RepID=M3CKC2_SPHMS|nr:uncharacterized protein SEPMUDRAFT_106582 [Sphaerulina musiva SO2202]EMF14233.1 hypothetical protein SEPMUDRAFT_106582 [Sphaerulina musiva SO2202]